MSNVLRRIVLRAAIIALVVQPGVAAAANLVTAGWLAKHVTDPALVILDASSPKAYAENHVPGAVNANMMVYGAPDIPAADMERQYQSWGVSPDKTIVMYDQGGSLNATRLFWALLYHGFPVKNLAVLDGGFSKWRSDGLPMTKEVPAAPAKGTFKIAKLNEGVRVRLPEFLTGSGDPANNVLVDALGANWHFGEMHPFHKAGHIPRGVLLPSDDFYNADKTFKPADEIRKMLDYAGIRREQNIYTYCGGGVAASVPFFAIKFIAGYPNVRLYTGSELEWLADERDLPYWTYDAPFLIRNANWLQFWTVSMVRGYLKPTVSIVDVRTAGAFSEGHVPFAVNLPADVFRSNLATPDRLAAILGPAGVNPAHEAVIVSSGGVTRESALAFVMLEKLGQKKISILTESVDQWAKLGFTVNKDATALPAAAYPANLRKDVVIADPNSTRGVYPKVFIASGNEIPAKKQNGTVVHVPFTDLLNADGTPKPAKDIWNILTKAGVPRYAELVCFSEDSGEAAANYFILKLMGYPDVKVLVM